MKIKENIQRATFPIIHYFKRDGKVFLSTRGTGFFINEAGYFLTCEHVMQHQGENSGFYSYGNIPYPSGVSSKITEIYRDKTRDIFLGKLESITPFIEITNEITIGENVLIYGYSDTGHPTITNNKVSLENVKKTVEYTYVIAREKNNPQTKADRFYTKGALFSGASGCPCTNDDGRVIGVFTATRESLAGDMIGVFISINSISDVISISNKSQ